MSENQHNLLTVKETAEYLNIPIPSAHVYVQKGIIPAVKIGGRYRIKRSSLEKLTQTSDERTPVALVLVNDGALSRLLQAMLAKVGYLATTNTEHPADVVVFSESTSLLDVLGAIDTNPNIAPVLLWGEPCPETVRTVMQYAPVTLLSHPVQLADIERLARMFGVNKPQPVALVA